MSDWLKKISAKFLGRSNHPTEPVEALDSESSGSLAKQQPPPLAVFAQEILKSGNASLRVDPTFTQQHRPRKISTHHLRMSKVTAKKEVIMVNSQSMDENNDNSNLQALKRLREQPRGTQVESRIAAIQNLLGETEIFKSLKMLRWPEGVVCPRCHSHNIVRREPPVDAIDQRHYYICLNCKGQGGMSDFDDFTGLPISSFRTLKQWVLCWYLIGFCSLAQIAKVLGMSIQEVMQAVTLENHGLKHKETHHLSENIENKTRLASKENMRMEEDLEKNRSASKSPLKPGYKSKK